MKAGIAWRRIEDQIYNRATTTKQTGRLFKQAREKAGEYKGQYSQQGKQACACFAGKDKERSLAQDREKEAHRKKQAAQKLEERNRDIGVKIARIDYCTANSYIYIPSVKSYKDKIIQKGKAELGTEYNGAQVKTDYEKQIESLNSGLGYMVCNGIQEEYNATKIKSEENNF